MEPDWHAHYACTYCHALRAKAEIIWCDDKPICKEGDCKNAHYRNTMPVPLNRGGEG